MRNKITTIIAVFLVGLIIFEGYLLLKNDDTIEDGEKSGTYVAELVDDEIFITLQKQSQEMQSKYADVGISM